MWHHFQRGARCHSYPRAGLMFLSAELKRRKAQQRGNLQADERRRPPPPSYALMHINWQMSVLAAENGAQLWVRGNIKTQLWPDINIVEGRGGEWHWCWGASPSCWVTAASILGLSQVSGSQYRKFILNILCLDCCLDRYISTFKSLKCSALTSGPHLRIKSK